MAYLVLFILAYLALPRLLSSPIVSFHFIYSVVFCHLSVLVTFLAVATRVCILLNFLINCNHNWQCYSIDFKEHFALLLMSWKNTRHTATNFQLEKKTTKYSEQCVPRFPVSVPLLYQLDQKTRRGRGRYIYVYDLAYVKYSKFSTWQDIFLEHLVCTYVHFASLL